MTETKIEELCVVFGKSNLIRNVSITRSSIMVLAFSAILIVVFFSSSSGRENGGCPSSQYLEIGGTGVLHCAFHQNFDAVLWYESTDIDLEVPLVRLIDSAKSGYGYDSGDYDVYLNGSLIIKNVSSIHDQTFTAVVFASLSEDPVQFSVDVTTTVKSKQDHPIIYVCGSDVRFCYAHLDGTSKVNCFIRDTRPAIPLKWFVRTAEVDREILFATNVTHDGITYTSHATTTNMFQYSFLSLLVCKAESPSEMLLEDEAFVLIENRNVTSSGNPIQTFVESGTQLKLVCSETNPDLVVWKKLDELTGTFVILFYAALFQNNSSMNDFEDYQMDIDGSLIASHAYVSHEGIYECSFGNGISGGKSLFNVAVHVPPVNEVQSAAKRHLLWLLVLLVWLLPAIILYLHCLRQRQKRQTEERNYELFDPYEALPLEDQEIYYPVSGQRGQTEESDSALSGQYQLDATKPPGRHPPLSDPKFRTLTAELKAMYKIRYGSVQPTRSSKLCVNSIFVDCGYKLMTSTSNERDPDSWENVKTYKEVLKRIDIPSVVVIEGDPGYGKSMLTLQLAHDWCNGIESSPIHDKDILILLRLRDVGGVQSVYKAIKEQILPRDSSLSENEIRNLLRGCNSGVLILDGFEEYPDLSTDNDSDIMSIVRGEMFQRFLVLITIRSFFLLKSHPPKLHRIKLAGFDEEIRDEYIRNVVAECDRRKEDKIRRCLHNVSVTDLLKIPLLFTTSAHISVEKGGFKNFRSLSSVIKFMINCLHIHMEKKMQKQDRKTVKSYQQTHEELDDVAFQIASGQHNPSWGKTKLCKKVGKEFYDYYKRVGILVENVKNYPGTLRPIREVQFFHELLYEWYAAHCLLRKFEKSELGFRQIQENMQLFKLRTVFLLACGISADFAQKTMEYLLKNKDYENFAFPCYMESGRKIDQISKAVNKIVASEVILDINQDKLLTWSTIQLLMAASRNEMPIACLQLKAYKSPVEFSDGVLYLQADICLPYLTTLEQLVIYEFIDMQISDETYILKYSSMCENIEALRFYHCKVAKTIPDACLTSLKLRLVSVVWETFSSIFYMNLHSGLWERDGTPLTDDDYINEIEDIQRHLGGRPSTSRDGEGK